jgi:RNA polymerase sigma-70 factor (ECF subfamily)
MSEERGSALDSASDDELVERARKAGSHDTRPFEALVRKHQAFVGANCRAITRLPNDAEDLAQEVFVKAFFGLRRFEGRAPFRAWLQRIKVNHCLNHLRKTRGAIMVDIDDVPGESDPALTTAPTAANQLQAAADRERIFEALDTMSDALRIPLMLRDGDGLSYDEIAEQLGISLSAVKMRIKRAREEFRRRFAALMPGERLGSPPELV